VGSDVRLQVLIQWSGLPAALATWEDVEALRQRFPRAPAWGQAGPYRRGDVSSSSEGAVQVHVDNAVQEKEDQMGPRRSTREMKPNTKVQGPEWK
jgi:hypothetical protein